MKNKVFKMMIFAALFMIIPFMNVNAKSQSVTDQESLKEALADSTVDTITLEDNIKTTEKIDITREVTIDGNGKEIRYIGTFKGTEDKTTWDSIYVLHVYRTNAIIKNITLTGGNAALNVNGSTVTLVGKIDVSGNGFGGIEMSKGKNVTEYPYIKATEATIVNTTENKLKPTLWIDGISAEEIIDNNVDIDIDESAIKGAVRIDENGQFQLYTKKENTPSGDGYKNLIEEDENDNNQTTETPVEKAEDNKADKNPNTYDNIMLYIVMALLGTATLGYSIKKVAAR